MEPLSTKSTNWTCQLVIATAKLVARLIPLPMQQTPVLCESIFAGSKAKRNWRPLSHRRESSGISVPFAARISWLNALHSRTSLCAWQHSTKTLALNQSCTYGVRTTYRGCRTVRTHSSIKSGNLVGNEHDAQPGSQAGLRKSAQPLTFTTRASPNSQVPFMFFSSFLLPVLFRFKSRCLHRARR